MIWIARIFEAWRNARQFEFPTEARGRLWHLFKYPQFSLLIGSLNIYFLIIHFGIQMFNFWLWNEFVAIGVVLFDAGFAYFVFEYFLKYFRKSLRRPELWKK